MQDQHFDQALLVPQGQQGATGEVLQILFDGLREEKGV